MLLLIALIAGCCTADDPVLIAPVSAWTDVDEVWELPLDSLVLEHTRPLDELEVLVEGGEHLTVGYQGGDLYAIPEAGWSGREWIAVEVVDKCQGSAQVEFDLGVGALAGDCTTTVTYEAQGAPSSVDIAGTFSEWERLPMTDGGDGRWSIDLELAEGAWPYKVVVDGAWGCDPGADHLQCDEGYDKGSWRDCTPGADACNSLLLVGDCYAPEVRLTALDIDRDGGSATLRVEYAAGRGGEGLGTSRVTLDGARIASAEGWDGAEALVIELSDLEPTRHTVRVEASDSAGRGAEPLYVPFWTDDLGWDRGLLYYVFVDRFANGDPANDATYGTTHAWTEYLGGDWAGVLERLDYLEDLGVTAIWLTAPVDNAEGVWGEKCNATFTGYHGYWPTSAAAPEEHFGDEALLRELVAGAHARNIRVLVDWVGNHVHLDHPYYAAHPEWYTPERLCRDGNNWDDIPETCWFDPFLPDIEYYQPEPLVAMVDDAVDLVVEYGFDGYRVDAVKHMPHAVYFNLQSELIRRVEHSRVGGDEDFYTVGETFDGDRALVGSYVDDRQLDAQFDFPLYFTLRSAFTDRGASLYDLQSALDASREAFAGHTMSTFLGNHDVDRFVTTADVGEWGTCTGDGSDLWDPAEPPVDEEPYLLLKLGWTWLLTHEGLPLVYYGDEIGLPGHGDPDNRQLMRFDPDLSAHEAEVLDHVTALAGARLDHPQLAVGAGPVWWEEADVWAWSRTSEHGSALVAVNRSWTERALVNGLSWAGLPEGRYVDVLTGDAVDSSGDQLTIAVPAMGSVVLVED